MKSGCMSCVHISTVLSLRDVDKGIMLPAAAAC
jgi:hypothetical protein